MKLILNGEDYVHKGDGRLKQLLRETGLAGRRVALVVNSRVVPLDAMAEQRLHDGDRVDILTLAGGG